MQKSLIFVLVLGLVAMSSASVVWQGPLSGNNNFADPCNWGQPADWTGQNTYHKIRWNAQCEANAPHVDATNIGLNRAKCNSLAIGERNESLDDADVAYLYQTGGMLFAKEVRVGLGQDDRPGRGVYLMSGGTLYANRSSAEWVELGMEGPAVVDDLIIGHDAGGNAVAQGTITMTNDPYVRVDDDLKVGCGPNTIGTLNLYGGSIDANDLRMGEDGGTASMVIGQTGVLTVKGWEATQIRAWINAGMIVGDTGQTVHCTYQPGADTTTVWAPEPATMALFGLGSGLVFFRRKRK